MRVNLREILYIIIHFQKTNINLKRLFGRNHDNNLQSSITNKSLHILFRKLYGLTVIFTFVFSGIRVPGFYKREVQDRSKRKS